MITKLFRTIVRLVRMDRTAGQADRYAHGSDIGAAVRAKAAELKAEAYHWIPTHLEVGHVREVGIEEGVIEACDKFVKLIDELTADAATSTQEEGIPTS
jgi:hypothetical protein